MLLFCEIFVIGITVHYNKPLPKSELITYLGVAPRGLGNTFMHLPSSSVFTATYVEFDKWLFPKYQNKAR